MSFYRIRLSDIDAGRVGLIEAAELVDSLPPDRTSAVYRALRPEDWMWGVAEHLAAMQADALRWIAWSKTKDAAKKPPRNMPKPIPRPGVQQLKNQSDRFKDVQAVPIDELKRRLAAPRRELAGQSSKSG